MTPPEQRLPETKTKKLTTYEFQTLLLKKTCMEVGPLTKKISLNPRP
jgi:hypothetical protein